MKPGKPVTSITYPGQRGIGHQWAYLPDVAETIVRLLEKPEALEAFSVFQMEGHWDADGTQVIAAIGKAVGDPNVKVGKMPWRLMRLLSPFVPLFRELTEMQYLWNMPIRMDNKRLLGVLGAEPHTPLDVAIRDTLVGLGCL
jgi:nucleoside-diphosphate-sugar epimerase